MYKFYATHYFKPLELTAAVVGSILYMAACMVWLRPALLAFHANMVAGYICVIFSFLAAAFTGIHEKEKENKIAYFIVLLFVPTGACVFAVADFFLYGSLKALTATSVSAVLFLVVVMACELNHAVDEKTQQKYHPSSDY